MVEEISKEEFTKGLKEDCDHECMLNRDYQYFKHHYRSCFENSIEALQELKRLHDKYNYAFVLKDVGDELC